MQSNKNNITSIIKIDPEYAVKYYHPLFINDNVAIVYSDYEKISEEGNRTGRIVKSDPYHHYKSLLCGNELGCLTVVYDTQKNRENVILSLLDMRTTIFG